MNFYGIFQKYKLNRPLNAQERACQLHQNESVDLLGGGVENDTTVISINSNYLELVDKFYPFKGIGSFISGGGFFMFLFCYLSILYNKFIYIGVLN
ncbi:MAG: hypothetical protein XXXJIFNMEKO3_02714 [Candidatus Erwinia impunctatus]|nr:hypothetical protein XXXJIFNMEKO_02714 [Culicoides impunctatus]